MNIKVLKSETSIQSTVPVSKLAYKVQQSNTEQVNQEKTETASFNIGNKVRHREEGLLGEIKFIGKDKLSIVWTDNSRERMTLAEAKETLEYVDDIQTIVSPLTPQNGKDIQNEKKDMDPAVNSVLNEALASLDDAELDSGEVIDMDIDLEKIKMQRKVNQLEQKLTAKQTDDMKEKIAKEIVDCAVHKGMIESDNADMEIMRVTMLNDSDFQAYKQSVLDYEDDGAVIESSVDDPREYAGLSKEEREAKKMLKSLRGGTRGSAGGFSSGVETNGSTRSIKGSNQEKFGFYNQTLPPSFEDQFTNILSEAVDDINSSPMPVNRTASVKKFQQERMELPGFENLQGITKPLMPGTGKTAAYQNPMNTGLKEMISSMDWTTVSKIH